MNGIGLTDNELRTLIDQSPNHALTIIQGLYYVFRKKQYLGVLIDRPILRMLKTEKDNNYTLGPLTVISPAALNRLYEFGVIRLGLRVLVGKFSYKLLPLRFMNRGGYITSICGPDGSGKSSACSNLARVSDASLVYFGIRSTAVSRFIRRIKGLRRNDSSPTPSTEKKLVTKPRSKIVTGLLVMEYFFRLSLLRAKCLLLCRNYILDRGPLEILVFNDNKILVNLVRWMSNFFLDQTILLVADSAILSKRSGEYSNHDSELLRLHWEYSWRSVCIANANDLILDVSDLGHNQVLGSIISNHVKN
jgi:hypothetical protein